MQTRCKHDDCFTCPYPDCIADGVDPHYNEHANESDAVQRKKERQRADAKKYYYAHRDEILEKSRKYRMENAETISARRKEKWRKEHAAARERQCRYRERNRNNPEFLARQRADQKKHYAKYRERILQRYRERRADPAFVAAQHEYYRKWRAAHREEQNAKRRAYYQEHKEEEKARRRAWYAENREEICARQRERYAQRKKQKAGKNEAIETIENMQ